MRPATKSEIDALAKLASDVDAAALGLAPEVAPRASWRALVLLWLEGNQTQAILHAAARTAVCSTAALLGITAPATIAATPEQIERLARAGFDVAMCFMRLLAPGSDPTSWDAVRDEWIAFVPKWLAGQPDPLDTAEPGSPTWRRAAPGVTIGRTVVRVLAHEMGLLRDG